MKTYIHRKEVDVHLDKYKLSLKKGETMNNKKLLKKGAAPVNAEIKKEKGEKKMKEFSVAGGVKNAWKNHKDLFKNVAILVLAAGCFYLGLRGPKVEVRYEQVPPVIIREEVKDPVEPQQEENAATVERN